MSIQVTTLSNPILSIDRRRNNRALQSSAFAVLRVHLGAGDLLPHLKGLLASDSHSSVVYPGGIARGVVDSDCPLREIVQRQSGEPAMCRHRGRRPVTAVQDRSGRSAYWRIPVLRAAARPSVTTAPARSVPRAQDSPPTKSQPGRPKLWCSDR